MEEQKTWVDVPKMYTLTKVGYLHNSSKVEFVFMLDCGFSRNTPYTCRNPGITRYKICTSTTQYVYLGIYPIMYKICSQHYTQYRTCTLGGRIPDMCMECMVYLSFFFELDHPVLSPLRISRRWRIEEWRR